MSAPKNPPLLQRAAIAVLETVRLEVVSMAAERDAAQRDLQQAGRNPDARADYAERATKLASEAAGAQRILQLLSRLARGEQAPGGPR